MWGLWACGEPQEWGLPRLEGGQGLSTPGQGPPQVSGPAPRWPGVVKVILAGHWPGSGPPAQLGSKRRMQLVKEKVDCSCLGHRSVMQVAGLIPSVQGLATISR